MTLNFLPGIHGLLAADLVVLAKDREQDYVLLIVKMLIQMMNLKRESVKMKTVSYFDKYNFYSDNITLKL